ncbi:MULTISPECIES: hypothetical protein [Actinoalloteichus]|uniref:Uncharacterized protein n=1 Tax=Actinoalloteichus fjordicus TaxID=1612552 RepID=A0AAC9PRG0_9PSEU|nr:MULTISPECIES: hypothetical protein [Actinoalloteichus]APU13927.1 hypothetical protein UA74_09315 [Actinoalloteichus fjordicus]APU19873.1 hypothetical protein UA75_09285 [Actinoalloteichus sp. GBA129-24]
MTALIAEHSISAANPPGRLFPPSRRRPSAGENVTERQNLPGRESLSRHESLAERENPPDRANPPDQENPSIQHAPSDGRDAPVAPPAPRVPRPQASVTSAASATSAALPLVVSVNSTTGRPESLVLVADRSARSVTLARRGRGLASLTVQTAEILRAAASTGRPAAAVEIAVVARDRRAGRLRVAVLGPQITMTLLAGGYELRCWQVPQRGALAAMLGRALAHLVREAR